MNSAELQAECNLLGRLYAGQRRLQRLHGAVYNTV